jgi:1-deoxy-D-xylulose-5-phosphate synthase
MCELAAENEKVCAITAAMPGGTGLLDFKKQYPDRLFDVGIAEEHAVAMAGGLAKQGAVPVVAIYSTFLQRAYDMILQDVCMLKQHVVFAVDRAGLVGEDGETHHGGFDVGFLRQAPSMAVLCPASLAELQDMMRWSVEKYDGPIAVRYPRGGDGAYMENAWSTSWKSGVHCHCKGKDVTIITYGTLINNAMEAATVLQKRGIQATVVRLLAVAPISAQKIVPFISENPTVVILEETYSGSGISQSLGLEIIRRRPDCRVHTIDLGRDYVTHGSINDLYQMCGLDADSIAAYVQEVLKVEN